MDSIEMKIEETVSLLRKVWEYEEGARVYRNRCAESARAQSIPIPESKVVYCDTELGRKIRDIRNGSGLFLTENAVMQAGQLGYEAFAQLEKANALKSECTKKAISERERKLLDVGLRLKAHIDDCTKRKENISDRDKELAAELYLEKENLVSEINKYINDLENINEEILNVVLFSVRKRSVKTKEELRKKLFNGDKSNDVEILLEALSKFPKEFVDGLVKYGEIKVDKKTARGYSSDDGQIVSVRHKSKASYRTAIHEVAHLFETACPIVLSLESEFYNRRTSGFPMESLNRLDEVNWYEDDEKARRDNFLTPYIGKDYKGRAYEIASIGFEYLFTEVDKLKNDTDFFKFILGLYYLVAP